VFCSSGSAHTCLAELLRSYMETLRHQSSTSRVPYHQDQCMFILYMADLEDQVSEHGVNNVHSFSNDTH